MLVVPPTLPSFFIKTTTRSLSPVPFEDISISTADEFACPIKILDSFLPDWEASRCKTPTTLVAEEEEEGSIFLSCKPLLNGITNKLIKCDHIKENEKESEKTVLIRVYGENTDLLIDREREIKNIVALNQQGLAPPIYGKFRNGMVYGFVKGVPYAVEDMRDPHKSALVAQRMADWHSADMSSALGTTLKSPILFPTIEKWLAKIPKRYSNASTQADFERLIDLPQIRSRMTWLQDQIQSTAQNIVFCHNDLLSGNILYDQEKDAAEFIDYEYGGFNYAAFDIANHFCEFAGFDGDYSLYPSKSFQLNWLRVYLERIEMKNVSDDRVSRLFLEVQIFALAAHLFWGVWALVQAEISDIDFNYLEYAKIRFDEFFKSPLLE